jgi:hypothetical protein
VTATVAHGRSRFDQVWRQHSLPVRDADAWLRGGLLILEREST